MRHTVKDSDGSRRLKTEKCRYCGWLLDTAGAILPPSSFQERQTADIPPRAYWTQQGLSPALLSFTVTSVRRNPLLLGK